MKLVGLTFGLMCLGCNKGKTIVEEASALHSAGDLDGALAKLETVATDAPETPEVVQAADLAVEWLVANARSRKPPSSEGLLRALKWTSVTSQGAATLCRTFADLGDGSGLSACLDTLKDALEAEAHKELQGRLVKLSMKPAGEVLTPDLLVSVEPEWFTRINGQFRADEGASCPALAKISGGDEFERHERKTKELTACTAENSKALNYLKECPFVSRAWMRARDYDFKRSQLVLGFLPERNYFTSDESRIWWANSLLLHWPGLLPDRKKSHRAPAADIMCIGGWVDNYTGFSLTTIDQDMSPEEAKKLKVILSKGSPAVEIAALLDGVAKEEPLACGALVPKTATGRILAWRLVVLEGSTLKNPEAAPRIDELPWHSVRDWKAPESCNEAKNFFGNGDDPPANSHTPPPSALQAWLSAQNSGDFEAYSKLYAPDFTGVKNVSGEKKRFDRKGWLNDRKGMFAHSFSVEASDSTVEEKDGLQVITFTQTWRSSNYGDRGTKVLHVRDGKVVREEQLASAPLDVGPTDAAWAAVREATVRGSSALKCETKVLDGYFRAVCGENDGGKPKAVSFTSKSAPGSVARLDGDKLVLIHPYTSGTEFTALFTWAGKASRLHVSWPAGAPQPQMVGAFDGAPSAL